MNMLSSLLKDLDLMSDDDIIELAMLHSESTFYAEEFVSNFNAYDDVSLSNFSTNSRLIDLVINEYYMEVTGTLERNKNNIHYFYFLGQVSTPDVRNTIPTSLYSDLLSSKKYPSRMGVMKAFHTSLSSVQSICTSGLDSLLKVC
ncbi:hypothetical protein EXT66_10015 [Pectobacterium carotovorum subsp. carotovorum]|nr:hypothetical protein [Pectobacterium carotovorum]MCL6334557.1 hypothetical protein [Pectobacterium carotovorum subsp. carotovorum]MCL6347769.1 hypothetical protein [Pectobacterium carotovorum subsp. carotovorum]MCL6401599.1 hypothetical protein [Pectobacterium carotovorum subsp. carotovorum]